MLVPGYDSRLMLAGYQTPAGGELSQSLLEVSFIIDAILPPSYQRSQQSISERPAVPTNASLTCLRLQDSDLRFSMGSCGYGC